MLQFWKEKLQYDASGSEMCTMVHGWLIQRNIIMVLHDDTIKRGMPPTFAMYWSRVTEQGIPILPPLLEGKLNLDNPFSFDVGSIADHNMSYMQRVMAEAEMILNNRNMYRIMLHNGTNHFHALFHPISLPSSEASSAKVIMSQRSMRALGKRKMSVDLLSPYSPYRPGNSGEPEGDPDSEPAEPDEQLGLPSGAGASGAGASVLGGGADVRGADGGGGEGGGEGGGLGGGGEGGGEGGGGKGGGEGGGGGGGGDEGGGEGGGEGDKPDEDELALLEGANETVEALLGVPLSDLSPGSLTFLLAGLEDEKPMYYTGIGPPRLRKRLRDLLLRLNNGDAEAREQLNDLSAMVQRAMQVFPSTVIPSMTKADAMVHIKAVKQKLKHVRKLEMLPWAQRCVCTRIHMCLHAYSNLCCSSVCLLFCCSVVLCRVKEIPEDDIIKLVNSRFSPKSTIARAKPLKEGNKPKSLDAKRNWLRHDGCYNDYHPTLPRFDQAAIAHMQYGKLPSIRHLHVGKMRQTDRKKLKVGHFSDIRERWANYLARCQEVYNDW